MTNKHITFQNSVVLTDIALIRNLNGVKGDVATVASAQVHGSFWFDVTDTTTGDDDRTCIVAADGGRWKLVVLDADSVEYQPGSASAYRDGSVGAALAHLEAESGGQQAQIDTLDAAVFSSGGIADHIAMFVAFILQLASSTGSSLVSYLSSSVGAVLRTLQSRLDDSDTLFNFMTAAQIADAKSNTGSIDSTAAWIAAANAGGKVFVPKGTYVKGPVSLIGKDVIFSGAGKNSTIVKANAAGLMFDVRETTDQPDLPFGLQNMTLDGDGIATGGIYTRYRHKTTVENLTVVNTLGDGLNELDSWNNIRSNLTLNNNVNGLVLQGANNNCKYLGISTGSNSGYQVKILNGGTGTVPGGSTALSFDACDFEFATGFGVYVNTTGVVRFNDCYIGEGIQGTVFDMAAGEVIVTGGVVQFGTLPTSYLGNLGGGKLLIKGAKIAGGASATVSNMFTSGAGRATIEDCPALIIDAGAQVMAGDCLDYGRPYDCFAPKLGRQATGFCLNGTFTSATTANELTVTCTSVTGSPCLLEIHANVTRNWIDGSAGALVVVYKSSQPCSVRLSQSPVGNTPAINITGTLPAAATVQTAVFYNWTYTLGVVPLILEIFQNATSATDTLTLLDWYLSDVKNTKPDGVATFYNMAKC